MKHRHHFKVRNIQIRALFIVLLALSGSAWALEPIFTTLFSDKAIRGFDTVAYFTLGKAVRGEERYSAEYKGATWLFSSEAHQKTFVENPSKYAPQYGGYCAYAVSQNTTASIQPELFTVIEGKLYLNYSKSINEKWLQDKQVYIDQADANWPSLLSE